MEKGDISEYEVIRCNKGGVIVQIGSIEGFIPFSLLDPTHIPSTLDRDDIREVDEGDLEEIRQLSSGKSTGDEEA